MFRVILYCVVPHYDVLCCVVLCYDVLCCVVLLYVVLYHIVFTYVMLGCDIVCSICMVPHALYWVMLCGIV